ncbi:MAG: MFS transporter, partial [Armatimonadetes bacterium]|nr:MFS transporter [Armatimonadota bacterium]
TAGGLLTEYLGWRAVFAVGVPLALLGALVAARHLRGEWAEARGQRFDWLGSLLYGPALVLLMYGFSHLPGRLGASLLAAGVVLLAAFLWWQARCPAPILDVRLFRANRPFALSNLAALINYSATAAVGFLLSLYLQYLGRLTPKQAGLVLVVQPLVMTLVSPWAGRLSDRVEPRLVASLGMGLSAVGLVLLQGLSPTGSLPWVLGCLVVLGAGFGLFSSPNTNAIMSSVERQHYGVASGTMGTMRLTGQMLSMGVVMLMFAAHLGRQPIGPSNYPLFLQSVRAAFALFAALCVGGIFASLVRGRIHR